MSGRTDVDAVWALLKAKTAPPSSDAAKVEQMMFMFNNGLGQKDLEPSQQSVTPRGASAGDEKTAPPPDAAAAAAAQQKGSVSASAQPRAATELTELHMVSLDAAMLDAALPRHMAALTDPSQQVRRRVLEQIKVCVCVGVPWSRARW